MSEVRLITFGELESDPNFSWLTAAYAEESQMVGLPPANCQSDLYRRMESTGTFHVLGAYHGGELVGFLNFIVTVLPHYGAKVATTESIFVANEFRRTGAGVKLIREMERLAGDMGALGVLVSAPAGKRLADVMPGLKYRQTNQVFFKGLATQ